MTDSSSVFNWVIRPGEVITQEQLEAEFGISYQQDPKQFEIEQLRLKQRIETWMRGQGQPVTVSTKQRGIQILSSAESVVYNAHRARQARVQANRAHRRLVSTVNEEDLAPDQRRQYERELEIQGAYCAAMRATTRQLREKGLLADTSAPSERVPPPPRRSFR